MHTEAALWQRITTINKQGLADYIDEYENIYYPVAEWITLVIHPSTDNSTIEDEITKQ